MTPDERKALDDLRSLAEAATPGPWGGRYFEDDQEGEAGRFARALEMSGGDTCWRLVVGGPNACNGEIEDAEKDDDWLNLAFMGNGPSSEANTLYLANVPPEVTLGLLDLIESQAARIEELTAELDRSVTQQAERMWATVYERAAWHHDIGKHDDSDLPYAYCPRCEMDHPLGRLHQAEDALRGAGFVYTEGAWTELTEDTP